LDGKVSATLSALIAVAGTLLGSLSSYYFQRQTAQRAEVFARAERLRQDRAAAYTAFSNGVMSYRRAQFQRWDQAQIDRVGQSYEDARARSYDLRSDAWQCLYRVQLLANDPELAHQAEGIIDLAMTLHHAADKDDLRARGTQIRQAIERFMAAASAQIV
jgi:hypothetical protein